MSQLSNNIYNYIKENSGMETLKTVRKYEKTLKKLARYRNHLTFAIRCKSFHIQPKGLRLKCALRTPKTRSIVETAERKLLHEHIHGIVQTIRTLKNDSRGYEERLCTILSVDIFRTLKEKMDLRERSEYEKVKLRQKNKFSRLAGFGAEDIREEGADSEDAPNTEDALNSEDAPTEDAPTEDAPIESASSEDAPTVTPEDRSGGMLDEVDLESVGHDEPPIPDPESASTAAQPPQPDVPLADGGVGGSRNLDGALREDGGLPSAGLDDLRTLVSETATTTAPVSQLSEADQSAPDNTGGYGRFKEKWVVNLSGEVLSDAERSVLSKGLNFVPTPKYINNVEFITEVEKLVSNSSMTQDEANKVRFEVTKALQSFKPSDDNLTAEERRALHHFFTVYQKFISQMFR